jgi:hypothetical protein
LNKFDKSLELHLVPLLEGYIQKVAASKNGKTSLLINLLEASIASNEQDFQFIQNIASISQNTRAVLLKLRDITQGYFQSGDNVDVINKLKLVNSMQDQYNSETINASSITKIVQDYTCQYINLYCEKLKERYFNIGSNTANKKIQIAQNTLNSPVQNTTNTNSSSFFHPSYENKTLSPIKNNDPANNQHQESSTYPSLTDPIADLIREGIYFSNNQQYLEAYKFFTKALILSKNEQEIIYIRQLQLLVEQALRHSANEPFIVAAKEVSQKTLAPPSMPSFSTNDTSNFFNSPGTNYPIEQPKMPLNKLNLAPILLENLINQAASYANQQNYEAAFRTNTNISTKSLP